MSVQAPPNLSADYGPLLLSGINDWGGVSPLTPDFVNPEAPWPEIGGLERLCARRRLRAARAAHHLPRVPGATTSSSHPDLRAHVRALADADGLARDERAPAARGGGRSERHLLPDGRGRGGPGPGARGRRPRRRGGGRRARGGAPPRRDRRRLPRRRSPGSSTPRPPWSCSPAGSPAGGSPCATSGPRADVLDALVRTGAAFLRTDSRAARGGDRARLAARGVRRASRWRSARSTEALDAIAAGAVNLVVGDWDARRGGRAARRHRPARARRAHRPFPPASEIDDARGGARAAPLHRLARPGGRLGRGAAALPPGRRGVDEAPPVPARRLSAEWEDAAWRAAGPEEGLGRIDPDLARILERSLDGTPPRVPEIERLFRARGPEVEAIAKVADTLRARRCGETVTYVINRNINYTNQCYFRCGFCGFSRGPKSLNLRGDPYILNVHEVVHRSVRPGSGAPPRSACRAASTPTSPATSTSSVLRGIKERLPEMHVHGFTPLEVWQGAHTLGVSVREFLTRLRDAGLGTLPGTAAEILDDRVRAAPVPGQGAHRRVGRGDDHRPRARPAGHHDDHVRPHRRAAGLGQPPRGAAPDPAAHGRVHRVRAAPLRAHGLADLPAGEGPPGADLGRGGAGARRRPDRPRRAHRQHPGLVGEAGPGRRRAPARAPAATTSAGR